MQARGDMGMFLGRNRSILEGSARESLEKEVQRLDEIDPATPGPKRHKRRKMT